MIALQASIGTLNDLVDAPRDAGREARQADPGRARVAAGRPWRRRGRAPALGLVLSVPSGPATLALAVVVPGDRATPTTCVVEGHRLVVAAVRRRASRCCRSSAGSGRPATLPPAFAVLVPVAVVGRGGAGHRQRPRRPSSATRQRDSRRSRPRSGLERAWASGGRAGSWSSIAASRSLAALARRRTGRSPARGRRRRRGARGIGVARRPSGDGRAAASAPGSSRRSASRVLAAALARGRPVRRAAPLSSRRRRSGRSRSRSRG